VALTEANEWDFIEALSTFEQYEYLSLRITDPNNTPELQKKYEIILDDVTEELISQSNLKKGDKK
jgi:hypothetical protein